MQSAATVLLDSDRGCIWQKISPSCRVPVSSATPIFQSMRGPSKITKPEAYPSNMHFAPPRSMPSSMNSEWQFTRRIQHQKSHLPFQFVQEPLLKSSKHIVHEWIAREPGTQCLCKWELVYQHQGKNKKIKDEVFKLTNDNEPSCQVSMPGSWSSPSMRFFSSRKIRNSVSEGTPRASISSMDCRFRRARS